MKFEIRHARNGSESELADKKKSALAAIVEIIHGTDLFAETTDLVIALLLISHAQLKARQLHKKIKTCLNSKVAIY